MTDLNLGVTPEQHNAVYEAIEASKLSEQYSFEGKVAFVTGAGEGSKKSFQR